MQRGKTKAKRKIAVVTETATGAEKERARTREMHGLTEGLSGLGKDFRYG